MYLTHGSQASVEGFGDRDGRRGARGTEDHREVRGIGDSSESLVGQVRSLRRHARACLALLAATALLALAAPAQAQTTTVTQSGDGATWSLVGENTVAAGQQTYTYTLTRTSGSLPLNEYFGFTSDALEAERFQDGYSDCTGTNYFCFTLSNSYSYSEFTVSNVRFAGEF